MWMHRPSKTNVQFALIGSKIFMVGAAPGQKNCHISDIEIWQRSNNDGIKDLTAWRHYPSQSEKPSPWLICSAL
jgi:hypothetical protein